MKYLLIDKLPTDRSINFMLKLRIKTQFKQKIKIGFKLVSLQNLPFLYFETRTLKDILLQSTQLDNLSDVRIVKGDRFFPPFYFAIYLQLIQNSPIQRGWTFDLNRSEQVRKDLNERTFTNTKQNLCRLEAQHILSCKCFWVCYSLTLGDIRGIERVNVKMCQKYEREGRENIENQRAGGNC